MNETLKSVQTYQIRTAYALVNPPPTGDRWPSHNLIPLPWGMLFGLIPWYSLVHVGVMGGLGD